MFNYVFAQVRGQHACPPDQDQTEKVQVSDCFYDANMNSFKIYALLNLISYNNLDVDYIYATVLQYKPPPRVVVQLLECSVLLERLFNALND